MDNGLWLVVLAVSLEGLALTTTWCAYLVNRTRHQRAATAFDYHLKLNAVARAKLQRRVDYTFDQTLRTLSWQQAHGAVHHAPVRNLHSHVDSMVQLLSDKTVIAGQQAHTSHTRFRLRNTENTAGRAVSIYECVECNAVHVYEGPLQ